MASHMLPVTLTFDSFLPRLIQSGVCVTLCHFFFFFFFLQWENPDKLFLQSVNSPRWQGNCRGDSVSARAAFSPLGSIGDLCGGFSRSTQTGMEINGTACSRTQLPFSGVNVTSDGPLDLWSSLKRSTVGDANLQTPTSGAAADLSRC